MLFSSDQDRTAGLVGFAAVDNFIQTSALISATNTSSCNRFPSATDTTCLSNGFLWLHGNYSPDIVDTWAAMIGPGVKHLGVDNDTWTDQTDLRPTLMTLVCLEDNYLHQGRALIEDLDTSALPSGIAQNDRLLYLMRIFKRVNAPVNDFGRGAILLSTQAIKSSDSAYAAIERKLTDLVNKRDALAVSVQAELGAIPGCTGYGTADKRDTFVHMSQDARNLLVWMQQAEDNAGVVDPGNLT